MSTLLVATRNKNKLIEIRTILADINVEIKSLNDIETSIDDVIEDKQTFMGNAMKKAFLLSRSTQLLTIADDSGLCIDYLKGGPGILSARFAGSDKDDHKNRIKVLSKMMNVRNDERTAFFTCSIALAENGTLVGLTEGICNGYITHKEIGENGFGYDSIFYYPPLHKTFGEIEMNKKNQISHRYKALQLMKLILSNYIFANKKA